MITLYRAEQDANLDFNDGKLYLNVGDHSARLSSRHPIARSVDATSIENVNNMLRGGHFLFEEGENGTKLREHRFANYTGFIQSDEFIQRFGTDKTLEAKLSQQIKFDALGDGGVFDMKSGFDWSVFSHTLKTRVGLVRLICTNGVSRLSNPIVEKQVPIINMYDEHLEIAATQTLETAKRLIGNRLVDMSHRVSSVRDVQLVATHVKTRLNEDKTNGRLHQLGRILDHNFSDYYTEHALESSAICSHLASHISQFDLYNILTEMSSHTEEADRSTKNALDKLASDMILDDRNDYLLHTKPMLPTFTSPEQAFFGI